MDGQRRKAGHSKSFGSTSARPIAGRQGDDSWIVLPRCQRDVLVLPKGEVRSDYPPDGTASSAAAAVRGVQRGGLSKSKYGASRTNQ